MPLPGFVFGVGRKTKLFLHNYFVKNVVPLLKQSDSNISGDICCAYKKIELRYIILAAELFDTPPVTLKVFNTGKASKFCEQFHSSLSYSAVICRSPVRLSLFLAGSRTCAIIKL